MGGCNVFGFFLHFEINWFGGFVSRPLHQQAEQLLIRKVIALNVTEPPRFFHLTLIFSLPPLPLAGFIST